MKGDIDQYWRVGPGHKDQSYKFLLGCMQRRVQQTRKDINREKQTQDLNERVRNPGQQGLPGANDEPSNGKKNKKGNKDKKGKKERRERSTDPGSAGLAAELQAKMERQQKHIENQNNQIANLKKKVEAPPPPAALPAERGRPPTRDPKPIKFRALDARLKGKTLCKKFIVGTCPHSTSDCKEHHLEYPEGKTQVCSFFQDEEKGCKFGDSCKNWHIGLGKPAGEYLVNTKREQSQSRSQSPSGGGRGRGRGRGRGGGRGAGGGRRSQSQDSRGSQGSGVSEKSGDECRSWAKYGSCVRGMKCKFQHSKRT